MYKFDKRVVITLDAGGTNLVFGAMAERNLAAAFLFGAGICIAGLCFLWKFSIDIEKTK